MLWLLPKKKAEPTIDIQGTIYNLASINRRLIAAIIDASLFIIIFSPLMNVMSHFLYGNKIGQIVNKQLGVVGDQAELMQQLYEQGFFTKWIIGQLIGFTILMVVTVWFWKRYGATPGKMLTKCKVLDLKTGEKPSLKKSIMRFICYIPSSLILGIGFFMIPLHKKRQGLHDILAQTAVVVRN